MRDDYRSRQNQYFLNIEVSLVPRPLKMIKHHVLRGLGTSESLIMKKYFERTRIIIPRSKMGSYTLLTCFVISQ